MPPPGYQPPPPGYYPPPAYYPPPPRPKKERPSNKPAVVGSLLVIVAVLGLITASFGFIGISFFNNADGWFSGEDGAVTTVSGVVESLNGTPLEGARISVQGESFTAIADEDGTYILYGVPMGDQTLIVEKEGFTTINHRVTLFGDPFGFEQSGTPEQDIDFVMSPGTGEVTTGNWIDEDFMNFAAFLYVCMAVVLICSVLALVGGWFAFKRTNLPFVVIGAIAGIFTFGLFIGSVLAFIALFVLLLSIDEFKGGNDHEAEE
jgi:hypothetical protein